MGESSMNSQEKQNYEVDIISSTQALSDVNYEKDLINKEFLSQKYIKEGLSCQEVAEIIGISRQGVWKALKRFGISSRSKKDAIFEVENHKCKISQGYLWIYNPVHPRSNGKYVKRATIVIENKLGRPLEEGEFPHHLNGNRLNDHPDNLEVTNRSEHFVIHFLLNPKESRIKNSKEKAKKLCADDIVEIRAMRRDGMKMQDIADYFHVGRTAIHNAVYGKCWGYIKD